MVSTTYGGNRKHFDSPSHDVQKVGVVGVYNCKGWLPEDGDKLIFTYHFGKRFVIELLQEGGTLHSDNVFIQLIIALVTSYSNMQIDTDMSR